MHNARFNELARKTEVRYAALGLVLGIAFVLVNEAVQYLPFSPPSALSFITFLAWPGAVTTMFLLGNRADGAVSPVLFFAVFNALIFGAVFGLTGFILKKSGRTGRFFTTLAVLGPLAMMFLIGMAVMSALFRSA